MLFIKLDMETSVLFGRPHPGSRQPDLPRRREV